MPLIYKKTLILIITFFLLLACSETPRNLESIVDLYAEQGNHEAIGSPFNGVLLVAKNDKIVLKKAYGFYNHAGNNPLQVDSRFLIGSITKQFTAMLIMQQVEKGNIALEKNVSDYLPYFPSEKGKELTIHRLLSHSAGLPHYEGLLKLGIKQDAFLQDSLTPDEYAQLIAKVDLISKPGTEFYYSSLGYILLGAILEKVSGKSYSRLIEENIARPLGLENTGYADNNFIEANVAGGYKFREHDFFTGMFSSSQGEYLADNFRHQSTAYSTGGMYSTVEDLWIWSQAVMNHKILSKELTEKMLTPYIGGYCYGWFRNHETIIRRNPGTRTYTHGGALEGFRSNIALYDDGTTIIFLANVTPVNVIRLTQNLHLAANNINIDEFRRDLLRPEIEDDLETFLTDGGMPALREYYAEISRRAGYEVLPAQLAYVELMTLYAKAGDKPQAVKIVDELLRNYSRPDQNIMRRIGYLFLKQKFYEEAIAYFKLNVENFPYSANVYDSLGEAFREKGEYRRALTNFEKAVELAEESSHPWLNAFKENLASVKSKLGTD